MKGKALATIAAAAALLLCLAGCSSHTQLDREVSIAGLTVSVPSDWKQMGDTDYDPTDPIQLGSVSFGSDDGDVLGISYSNASLDETAEEAVVNEGKSHEGFQKSDFSYEKVGESVIDGADCQIYSYGYVATINGQQQDRTEYTTAYIFRPDMHYSIDVTGDAVSIDDVLETVSIS